MREDENEAVLLAVFLILGSLMMAPFAVTALAMSLSSGHPAWPSPTAVGAVLGRHPLPGVKPWAWTVALALAGLLGVLLVAALIVGRILLDPKRLARTRPEGSRINSKGVGLEQPKGTYQGRFVR